MAAWHGICPLLRAMLQHIGFPATNTVIRACRQLTNEENPARIDDADPIALTQELGILDMPRGLDSFASTSSVN